MISNKNLLSLTLKNFQSSTSNNLSKENNDSFVSSQTTSTNSALKSENYKALYLNKLSFGRSSDKILVIGPPNSFDLTKKRLYAYPKSFSCELKIPSDADISLGNLTFADLTGLTKEQIKTIDFRKVNLTGAKLSGLNLTGKDFSGTCLVFADLSGTNLTDANFSRCDLSNSLLLNANLTRTNFSIADLKMASLSKTFSTDDLIPTNFDNAHLDFAYIASSKLPKASFKNALMFNAVVYDTNLQKADFNNADMTNVSITENTDLSGVKFIRTNLTNAKILENTNLSDTFFHAANLTGTEVSKANLQDSTIYASTISGATFKLNNMKNAKIEHCVSVKSSFVANDWTKGSVKESVFLDTNFKDNKITDTPMEEAIFTTLNNLDPSKKATNNQHSSQENEVDIDFKVYQPLISTKDNPTGFDKVAGMEEIKDLFRKDLINKLKYPDIAKGHNAKIPNATLLYGEGGCGKTFIVEALVEETAKTLNKDVPFLKLENTESIYQHGTTQLIGEHFKKAKELAKKHGICIVLLDEAEKLIRSRNDPGNHQHNIEETSKMLNQLNSLSKEGVFVIAATNYIEMLDKNAIRTGRFDHKIKVGLPPLKALKEAIVIALKTDPSASQLVEEILDGKHNKILDKLDGLTFSDAGAISQRASSLSFNEAVETKDKDPNAQDVKTSIKHLAEAVDYVVSNKIATENQTNPKRNGIGYLANIN